MNCPCGTEKDFERCCAPFLNGDKIPETAEKLMRSRYTAFTRIDIPYIKKTLAPESRKGFDSKELEESAKKVKWKGLTILSTERGGPGDTEGVVEFKAVYEHGSESMVHHEVSEFRKDEGGHWLFVDGKETIHKAGEEHSYEKPQTVVRDAPKVGRNEPCPCGSGKKSKKCCAA